MTENKNPNTMTKAEMIAEIIRIMMKLAGEPEEAIEAQMKKCLEGGADHERTDA